MKIIIRSCGERTEQRCIKLAKRHGTVNLVKEIPFGESLRKSYELGLSWNQNWIPMIDADVLLDPGTIRAAVKKLDAIRNDNIFCWDGHTKDKIMIKKRRAGIHIYNREMLADAMQFIDDKQLKPESHVRKQMHKKYRAITYTDGLCFGMHDFEQYYRDLWRKGFCQAHKLANMINRSNIIKRWRTMSLRDKDFLVIWEAHKAGRVYRGKVVIDVQKNYGASQALKRLGLREKGRLI